MAVLQLEIVQLLRKRVGQDQGGVGSDDDLMQGGRSFKNLMDHRDKINVPPLVQVDVRLVKQVPALTPGAAPDGQEPQADQQHVLALAQGVLLHKLVRPLDLEGHMRFLDDPLMAGQQELGEEVDRRRIGPRQALHPEHPAVGVPIGRKQKGEDAVALGRIGERLPTGAQGVPGARARRIRILQAGKKRPAAGSGAAQGGQPLLVQDQGKAHGARAAAQGIENVTPAPGAGVRLPRVRAGGKHGQKGPQGQDRRLLVNKQAEGVLLDLPQGGQKPVGGLPALAVA